MENKNVGLLEAPDEAIKLKLGTRGILLASEPAAIAAIGLLAEHTTGALGKTDATGFHEMVKNVAQFTEKNLLVERQKIIDKGINQVDANRIIALRTYPKDGSEETIYVGTPKNLVLQLMSAESLTDVTGSELYGEALVEGIGDEESGTLLYSIPFVLAGAGVLPVLERVAVLEANHLIACANLHRAISDQQPVEIDFHLGDGRPYIDTTQREPEIYRVFTAELNRYIFSRLHHKKAADFLALGPEKYPGQKFTDTAQEMIEGILISATAEQRLFLVNEALENCLVKITPADMRAWKESISPDWFEIEREIARKLVAIDKKAFDDEQQGLLPKFHLNF